MADLLELESWRLSTADLIQQVAALIWVHKGDEHKALYETVTGARVAYELYNRLTTNRDIELYQTQCIMGIVEYIKAHPGASEADLTKEVQRHVQIFKQNIEHM